jgi:putative nucleotidyltransferase with HDIG domain
MSRNTIQGPTPMQMGTGSFCNSAEELGFFRGTGGARGAARTLLPATGVYMETAGDSMEERAFFTGPSTTRDPERKVRLEARKAAAKIMRALAGTGSETETHCERVALWSRRIARELGLSSERVLDIELGALLHDIGYIAMSNVDLDQPRALTATEWSEQRRHCELGASMLREIPLLRRAVPLLTSHHEEFDGTGYPHGLAGLAIPVDGRIFHLVDAYESLTSERPYRAAMSDEQARIEIARGVGTSFDPLVHAAFARIDPSEWRALVANIT